jgi:hypothetical protein
MMRLALLIWVGELATGLVKKILNVSFVSVSEAHLTDRWRQRAIDLLIDQ